MTITQRVKGMRMSKKYNRRLHLDQMFSELGVGWSKGIDQLTDDELEELIYDIKDLLVQYPMGVEDNDFIDKLGDIVNGYTEGGKE